jgi:hypothetical protein
MKSALTTQIENVLLERIDGRSEFGCLEVTLGWYGNERVDFITYSTNRIIRCFEIKVSKSDFNSQAKLSFFGNLNYFVIPIELFDEVGDEIPYGIGCYCYFGDEFSGHLECKKNAKHQDLKADREVILSSMLRSLMREFRKGEDTPMRKIYELREIAKK